MTDYDAELEEVAEDREARKRRDRWDDLRRRQERAGGGGHVHTQSAKFEQGTVLAQQAAAVARQRPVGAGILSGAQTVRAEVLRLAALARRLGAEDAHCN